MSYAGGRAGRDQGMARVDAAANEAWKRASVIALVESAIALRELTSDDVKDRTPSTVWTHDERGLGPIMVTAARDGWIEKTERFVPSRYTSRHVAPIRVWKSLLFRGDA